MEINDELILKWEPKIQKLATSTFIIGMDKDDIAQELRIAILKAAKAYDSNRGIIFHTYLHTTMINTIRTLMNKAQEEYTTVFLVKQANEKLEEELKKRRDKVFLESIDMTFDEEDFIPWEITEALQDPIDYYKDSEFDSWLASKDLNFNERLFIILKLEGLTMEEITEDLGESAYKIRQLLRKKFKNKDLYSQRFMENLSKAYEKINKKKRETITKTKKESTM